MLRPYRESDLEAVVLLFNDSVHHLADKHYDKDRLAAWAPQPPDLKRWAARLASADTWVVETDGKLLGFIAYEPNGHIDLLFTSPAHCHRGIASTLLRHAETALAARGISTLFTEASLTARPFFERFGFEVTEEQDVQRRGVTLRRYAMRKWLVS